MTPKTKTHEEHGDLGEAIRLANEYAHCFSFVDDKTMPEAQTALFGHLEKVIPQWQPIETAPMDGSDVLILTDTGFIHQASWWIEEDRSDTITHWMPLPSLPTTTELSS